MICIVEDVFFHKKYDIILLGEWKMRIDYIINELLEKIDYAGIRVDTIEFKPLDKKSIYRL